MLLESIACCQYAQLANNNPYSPFPIPHSLLPTPFYVFAAKGIGSHFERVNLMEYRNILFDLDGTLTDPYLGITNAVKYSLQKFNIEERNENTLRAIIGPPLETSFMEFYQFDANKTKTAIGYYREYYSEKGIYENKLYPDIDTILAKIRDAGKTLILATSKPAIFASKILEYFNIDKYFYDITGSNLDGTLVEKDEIIKFIMEKHDLKPETTIMIGDRKYDISGAHKNNIHSIAVMYGYGSKEELEQSKPTYFCENTADIWEIIR